MQTIHYAIYSNVLLPDGKTEKDRCIFITYSLYFLLVYDSIYA